MGINKEFLERELGSLQLQILEVKDKKQLLATQTKETKAQEIRLNGAIQIISQLIKYSEIPEKEPEEVNKDNEHA